MRVLTYNMLHAPGDRLEALLSVVREAQPDVLACQEIDDIDGLLELSRSLGMPAVIGHANRPESPPEPEHLAILSRWPIERVCVHRGDAEAMFRPVLETWIAPPQGELIGIFTVHFRAFPGAPGSEVKLREVQHLCETLQRATGDYCAVGDFNAWAPGEGDLSPGWREQLPEDHRAAVRGGVIAQLQAIGMVDTWRYCHPAPEAPVSTLRHSAARVDYIWASPALAPKIGDAQILQSEYAAIASDHYPVLATFNLADAPPTTSTSQSPSTGRAH